MFRVIGAAVVYGFATYGFLVWLRKKITRRNRELEYTRNVWRLVKTDSMARR